MEREARPPNEVPEFLDIDFLLGIKANASGGGALAELEDLRQRVPRMAQRNSQGRKTLEFIPRLTIDEVIAMPEGRIL